MPGPPKLGECTYHPSRKRLGWTCEPNKSLYECYSDFQEDIIVKVTTNSRVTYFYVDASFKDNQVGIGIYAKKTKFLDTHSYSLTIANGLITKSATAEMAGIYEVLHMHQTHDRPIAIVTDSQSAVHMIKTAMLHPQKYFPFAKQMPLSNIYLLGICHLVKCRLHKTIFLYVPNGKKKWGKRLTDPKTKWAEKIAIADMYARLGRLSPNQYVDGLSDLLHHYNDHMTPRK